MQGGLTVNRTWLVAAAVVLAGLALRWLAFAPFDISHADEIMQYLEQGKRLATGEGIVPWEYRYGARNGLIAQLLSLPWALGERIAPGTLAPMLAARWSFLALTLLALPAAWKLGALTGRAHALAALFVAALWYESVLFSTLMLSEVLATGLIALGAALLLGEARSARTLGWAGLLLGLGVIVRLQYAPFVAVLVLACLRLDRQAWLRLLVGGAASAVIGAASDLAMGRWPFEWIWVNFTYNIGESRAARFGASGPLEYIRLLLLHLGPAAPLILAGAILTPPRYRPLVLAVVANLVFHSLIAHKEYRFVWLSTLLIVVLSAIASVRLIQTLAQRRGRELAAWMLGLLGLTWLGLSLTAEAPSGGARTMRGGAPIPLAALAGAERGQTCGIALPDQWRAHLVPALLPRPVPLYIAPAAVTDRSEPLPPDLTAAANALVFAQRPRGAEAYREVTCRTNGTLKACLYLRPGTCTDAPHWRYQAALEREDL
jgi:phosphatidylinositol glycan class B